MRSFTRFLSSTKVSAQTSLWSRGRRDAARTPRRPSPAQAPRPLSPPPLFSPQLLAQTGIPGTRHNPSVFIPHLRNADANTYQPWAGESPFPESQQHAHCHMLQKSRQSTQNTQVLLAGL